MVSVCMRLFLGLSNSLMVAWQVEIARQEERKAVTRRRRRLFDSTEGAGIMGETGSRSCLQRVLRTECCMIGSRHCLQRVVRTVCCMISSRRFL